MAGESVKSSVRKFQPPKGTRDFYPADLAVRRHIENVWRQTSINHGFEEIDGPTFEHLDLYTHKSGPGIASELFQVFSGKDPEQAAAIRSGENAPYALRPEFTPTLARMVADRAPQLPRPIKWFAIPSHFRAESPQRGRLREFMQWNVDFIGDDSPRADAEVIATAVSALSELGLTANDVRIELNHREFPTSVLARLGYQSDVAAKAFDLLDRRAKMSDAEFASIAAAALVTKPGVDAINKMSQSRIAVGQLKRLNDDFQLDCGDGVAFEDAGVLEQSLIDYGIDSWCRWNISIVRGLAYYTGTVFEIHETSGAERAIAGGGRYDKLIEGFGGPSLPACGFGMGDVVLANVLHDKGLLTPPEEYLPRPDAFVIAASDDAAAKLPAIVADLRRRDLHVRQSYKATRNVGKLLGDAGKCRARFAVILGAELAATSPDTPRVALKDMDSGEQREVALSELPAALRKQ